MEPTQIEWSEKFTVGHQGLDDEHRRFIELINSIYAAIADNCAGQEMDPLLDGMLKLAGQHFRHENSILLSLNASPLPSGVNHKVLIKAIIEAAFDKHIANHASTLPQLESIIRGIRFDIDSPQPHASSDLKDWFLDHASVYDAHLRPVFRVLNRPTA